MKLRLLRLEVDPEQGELPRGEPALGAARTSPPSGDQVLLPGGSRWPGGRAVARSGVGCQSLRGEAEAGAGVPAAFDVMKALVSTPRARKRRTRGRRRQAKRPHPMATQGGRVREGLRRRREDDRGDVPAAVGDRRALGCRRQAADAGRSRAMRMDFEGDIALLGEEIGGRRRAAGRGNRRAMSSARGAAIRQPPRRAASG